MKKSSFLPVVAKSLALLCAALALAIPARAGVPRTISYQGYLTDDAGQPLTGPVAVTFRLFAQLADGTEAWSESHPTVNLDEGHFAVALGSITALPADFSQPLFLEIEVAGETLSPRLPLRAVPYALQAANVDDQAVVTKTLANQAVTKAKLGNDIAGEGLAQNEDGSLRIALAAVTGGMIANEAIANEHVATDAAIDPSKIAGTAVTLDGTETLTNKTLTDPVIQVRDTDFTIVDDTDPAASVQLQLSSPYAPYRTGGTTLTIPRTSGTIALQEDVANQLDTLATVAWTNSYTDLDGLPDLHAVATSGSFLELTNLPGIFSPVAVIPGDGSTAPPNVDALGTDDTLILEGTGPIALGNNLSRTAAGQITIGLRVGDGLLVNEDQQLAVLVDGLTIGFDEGMALEVTNVPASRVGGLADVATSGDFGDLGGVPSFAELNTANTFTAPGAITLDPIDVSPDTILLQVLANGERATLGGSLFSVDNEGDVVGNSFTGNSFAGNGSALTDLNADNLTTGTVSLSRLPIIPTSNITGLASIATSGGFADLAGVPDFARRDEPNAFTADSRAISLEPVAPATDAVMLQLLAAPPVRGGRPAAPVFRVDAEGDVFANSFAGNGSALTDLNAGSLVTGTVALARLPSIPAANITGLADIATSGGFADLGGVPDFARRDQPNVYTGDAKYTGAGTALSLDHGAPQPADTVLLQAVGGAGGTTQVFRLDSEGDVFANSFAGNGSALTDLNAGNLVTGTVPLARLPSIPATSITGLADIATSGGFADLAGVPDFARRDQPNVYSDEAKFTGAGTALKLEYGAPQTADTPLVQAFGGADGTTEVFRLDSDGDVAATSFTGDGAGLVQLNASALVSGTVSLGVLPDLPASKVTGLATIATSGGFADLGGVPDFARRDQPNVFIAASHAISLEPVGAAVDDAMLQLLSSAPVRGGRPAAPVFRVDTEGDVFAASFTGDGANLTGLDAGNIASGILASERLAGAVDGDAIQSGAVAFSKLDLQPGDLDTSLLTADSFDVQLLGGNLTSTTPTVALGDTLDLSIDTAALASDLTGWGLMAGGSELAIDLAQLAPALPGDGLLANVSNRLDVDYGTLATKMAGNGLATSGNQLDVDTSTLAGTGLLDGEGRLDVDYDAAATALAGNGLLHDADDTLAVKFGQGLRLNGANELVPDVDDTTIEVNGASGKLAVKSIAAVPVAVPDHEDAPQKGSLMFADGALQVYDGTGWIKIGTYQ
jgi:hypothetical protein